MGAIGALMCPPAHYGIPAIENPHMDPNKGIDEGLALREWTDLFNLLQMFGLSIRLMDPIAYHWDMVFTANGGWAHGDRALVANFRHLIRRPEKPHFWEAFRRLGFDVESGALRGIPTEPLYIPWEGQGDTLMGSDGFCFFGHGIRSDRAAMPYIKDMLKDGETVVPLELVNPHFYHLDTCATALRPRNTFIYYPKAFSLSTRRFIEKFPFDLIELSPVLANCFVANSIYLEDVFLLNVPFGVCEESRLLSAHGEFLVEKDPRFIEFTKFDKGGYAANKNLVKKMNRQKIKAPFCTQDGMHGIGYVWFIKQLWDMGMKVVPVYTSQFEQSGAGARCCVMFLDWLLPPKK